MRAYACKLSIAMIPRHNNLHALRLLFALQVLLVHVSQLQNESSSWLDHFSGVPAFFFLSGFLIHAAYLNSDSLYDYARNRALRLLPALWLVTLVSAMVLVWIKGVSNVTQNPMQWLAWIVGQGTIGQAYNPAIFRDIGLGVINGVLWTITVEILFYFLLPVLVFLEKNITRHAVLIFAIASYVIYNSKNFLSEPVAMGKSVYDFLSLTPLVWGWMFAMGILAHKHFEIIQPQLKKFGFAIVPVLILIVLNQQGVLNTRGNYVGIVYYFVLMMVVLYAAFSIPSYPLAADFSYGLYIWHAPVINLCIVLYGIEKLSLPVVVIASFFLATLSWYLIEAPALRLKHSSIVKR